MRPQHEDSDLDQVLEYTGDSERLLDGENPDTTELEDAALWEGVYQELVGFKQKLVNSAESSSRDVSQGGEQEVVDDLTILKSEATRLQARLEFWQQRRAELEGNSV